MELVSRSPQETQKFAADLAANVIAAPLTEKAKVIALHGDLGAGKTTFTQGFTKALGVEDAVKSPTFLLIKKYNLENNRSLYHIDCYRVNDYKELLPLEIEDVLANPKNIVLIEWAERITPLLPSGHTIVSLAHVDEQTRSISITND